MKWMKMSCCCILLSFLVMNCSFAYQTIFAKDIIEQPTVDKLNSVELLNDEDVLDGYANCDLEYVSEQDKMSADDILLENKIVETNDNEVESELSVDDWRLLLINKQNAVPEDYTFTLGTIKGSMQCDERILPDLLNMLKAAKKDGVNLVICSPYRDFNRQEMLFNRKIKTYIKQGMSYLEAYSFSAQTVTVPGASEHQVGLALDIISDKYSLLNDGFGETEAGIWLKKHCCEFGFILRYPKGKEKITGIEYEPWHFRYVGQDAATIIMDQNITLEEFIDSLSN